MNTKTFYSNGKLLLSGEYVILDGGLGWAIPTKYGQYLKVTENISGILSWKSLDDQGQVWFEAKYGLPSLAELSSSDSEIAASLLRLLKEAQKLESSFLKDSRGCAIETVLTFPRDWGLGSSSTLINNLANWAEVDAYKLLRATFGGSGYDIASAKHNTPILYHLNKGLPEVEPVAMDIPFIDSLYFVYLNQKKNSRDAIRAYRKKPSNAVLIDQLSQISRELITTKKLEDFEHLLHRHEQLLSKAMGIATIQDQLFADYPKVIKSLGAWGGDFVLVTGDATTPEYFKEKGYDVVIPFSKMVLKPSS